MVADTNGAFTRFLGVELAAPDAPGARSQRYAAVVDDGVLLKVVSWEAEASGADFGVFSAMDCRCIRRSSMCM